MRYRAALFDLAGTLVEFSPRAYREVVRGMAGTLGVPASRFEPLWNDAIGRLETGSAESVESALGGVVVRLGGVPEPDGVSASVASLLSFARDLLTPRTGAPEALLALRSMGLKLGLAANQAAFVADLWPTCPLATCFDAAIFSCQAGVRKPDRAIYDLVAGHLGVEPRECLFVGDGGSNELSGAAAAGMRAIQMRFSEDDPQDVAAIERESWAADQATDFNALVALVNSYTT